MAKWMQFGQAARNSLIKGSSTLAKAVGVTLGPKGRTVILKQNWAGITVVSDGFTIARELELANPFEDMGVMLIKDAADKVYEQCGDGTSTTIILASAIVGESNRIIAAGADQVQLVRGIRKASQAICDELERSAISIKKKGELLAVAVQSVHDNELANLIVEAAEGVGPAGAIIVEQSKSIQSSVEILEGFHFEGGYINPGFITDITQGEAVIEDPHLLITDAKLARISDILPALERIIPITTTLVILCDTAEDEALAGLLMNRERGNLDVLVSKAPGLGGRQKELLLDIAAATGGNVLPDEEICRTLAGVTEQDLGRAERVVSTNSTTRIVGGVGDQERIESRMAQIQSQINTAQTAQYRRSLTRRLGALAGRTAVINVGGFTEYDIKEKKQRVENAVASVRMAVEGGVLPGAGVGLLQSISAVESLEASGDEIAGIRIMQRAAQVPIRQIATNAGVDGSMVVDHILRGPRNFGFNAESNEFGNLFEMGIIEPALLPRTIIATATSIATSLLTVDTAVVYPPEKGPGGTRPDISAKYE